MSRTLVFLITFALVCTSATQLRAGDLPLGIGEVLLVLGVACVLWRDVIWNRAAIVPGPVLGTILAFWVLQFSLFAAGTVVREALAIDDFGTFSHDVVALSFAATTSFAISISVQQVGVARCACLYLALLSALVSSALLLLAITVDQVGPVEFWYALFRFRGWAENPNQFALLAAASPFICLHFAAEAGRGVRKTFLVCCALALFVSGVATASDALVVAWLGAAALYAAIHYKDVLFGGSRSRLVLAGSSILLPAILIGVLAVYGNVIVEIASTALAEAYSAGDQGSVRLTVWLHAVTAWFHSPIVGLGPGAYSGMAQPLQGFEAHNTLLDWAASSGVLGLGLLLILYFLIVVQVLASRRRMLLLALASLLCFGLFHNVMRQPLYWGWLILLYQFARDESERFGLASLGVASTRPIKDLWRRTRLAG